jgi:hypothetical protein
MQASLILISTKWLRKLESLFFILPRDVAVFTKKCKDKKIVVYLTNELNTRFFCSTSPLKAPNRLKSLKLAGRFVIKIQEKIFKF